MSGTLRRNGILGGPIGSGDPVSFGTLEDLLTSASDGSLAPGFYQAPGEGGQLIIVQWDGINFDPPLDLGGAISGLLWSFDLYSQGALWDAAQENPVALEEDAEVGSLSNLAFNNKVFTSRSARERNESEVTTTAGNEFDLFRQPGGHLAVDGRTLPSTASLRPETPTSQYAGAERLTVAVCFSVFDKDADCIFWGTQTPGSGADGLFFGYVGTEGERTFRLGGRSLGGTTAFIAEDVEWPAFEDQKVKVVFAEFDFLSGELRVFGQDDLDVPFLDEDGWHVGAFAGARAGFMRSGSSSRLTNGAIYRMHIFDDFLTPAEKNLWLQQANSSYQIDRPIRWEKEPEQAPGNIPGLIGWWKTSRFDAFTDVERLRHFSANREGDHARWIFDCSPEGPQRHMLQAGSNGGTFEGDYFRQVASGGWYAGDEDFLAGSEEFTFYLVIQTDTPSQSNSIWFAKRGGTAREFNVTRDSNRFACAIRPASTVFTAEIADTSTDWHIYKAIYTGSNLTVERIGGPSDTVAVSGAIPSDSGRLSIARYDGGFNAPVDPGRWAEIMAFNRALTPSEQTAIETYLEIKHDDLLNP